MAGTRSERGGATGRRALKALILASALGVTVWLVARGASWPEYLGFVTGVACVWFVMENHIVNWPLGLLNVSLLFVVFLDARLYADMWLQAVYFVLGVAGWWMWARTGDRGGERPTTAATPREAAAVLGAVVAGWAGLYWYFGTFTSAAAPLWDSLLTATSLGAQFLLMRRVVENWLFWIAADVGYVALFASRGLGITAVLYVVYLALAVTGWREWRADLAAPEPAGA